MIDKKNCFMIFFQSKKVKQLIIKEKDYFENHKQRLREQASYKYRNLSERERTKRRECRRKRYHNKSTKTKKYQKNYHETRRSQYNNQ